MCVCVLTWLQVCKCVCVYLVLVETRVYDIQKCVCLCGLLSSVAQLCGQNCDRSREGAKPVINCNPAGEDVHLQGLGERLCKTAGKQTDQ